MRRACLAIGVSRAEKLDRLPAAATAAEEVGLWARQSGFADPADVIVLTDAKQADGHWQPVTVGRIRAALDQLFAAGSIDTLVLQFTGHGMRGSIGQAIWLPTDWESERRAINVELLKKNLGNMGVANLTIFGDACKSSARDLTPDDLTPDGVLGRGTTIGFNPKLDRFDAVHEGMSAFMVPGATPAQSRCVFSGAVIEGLWATDPRAFDGTSQQVTSGSLHDFLSARVDELGIHYGLSCAPDLSSARPADHVVYIDRAAVGSVPSLPAWPERVLPGDAPPPPPDSDDDGFGGGAAAAMPPPMAGPEPAEVAREVFGQGVGASNPNLNAFERSVTNPAALEDDLRNWGLKIELAETESGKAISATQRDWMAGKARIAIEATMIGAAEGQRADTIRRQLERLVTNPNQANLVFAGEKVAAIWARSEPQRVDDRRWLVATQHFQGEQVLIEFPDQTLMPMVVYHGLIAAGIRRAGEAPVWMGVSLFPASSLRASARLLAQVQSGTLQPAAVDGIAAQLREYKHADPTLGAICAYLYDFAGDGESVRRMAAWYLRNGQPVPFDIALMGELWVDQPGGQPVVQVLDVERRADHGAAGVPNFVTSAMSGGQAPLGGLCPWLRQGWDFIGNPTEAELPLVRMVPDVRAHLLPGPFTHLDRAGGELLADHWNLERWT